MATSLVGSTIARHQLASLAATLLDFGAMTLLVEAFGVGPAPATLVGASLGALLNFTLNRRHTFRAARGEPASPQVARYALVSGLSAALNAGGELVFAGLLGAPYFPVRVLTALAVGVGWNYPMHRFFVFRAARPETVGAMGAAAGVE